MPSLKTISDRVSFQHLQLFFSALRYLLSLEKVFQITITDLNKIGLLILRRISFCMLYIFIKMINMYFSYM
jgi:hypothetical protein